MSRQKLIILTGPTAVGKSALSVKLAQRIGAEIISADSMQVYRYMDIGTAKITEEETEGITHHLLSILDPSDAFNVYRFVELAKQAICDISKRGKIPLVVGGTGFYIRALLYDVDFSDSGEDCAYRKELEEMAAREGNHALHELLKTVDPLSYELIHENNVKRVIRALEYFHDTKEPISVHNAAEREKESPYDFRYFVLTDDREKIYERIDARVDQMIEKGLIDEVGKLLRMGYDKDLTSMQGLGYKELIPYLNGDCELEESIRIIKRDSRHYAKRQLTWFRREKDVVFINRQDYNCDDNIILNKLLQEIGDVKTD